MGSGSRVDNPIIKNPAALPNLGEVTHVFLDKTGTLTRGEFSVDSLYLNGKLYVLN